MRHALGRPFRVMVALLSVGWMAWSTTTPVHAVPAFAKQTKQPCAVCHVGAIGPLLTPYGRDFKIRGFVAGPSETEGLPIAVAVTGGFQNNTSNPAPGARPGSSFTFNGGSLYYAGRVTKDIGAFASYSFDVPNWQGQLGRLDIRHAREVDLFGKDLIVGVSANNNPTITDPWNSFARSTVAARPRAATTIDGRFRQKVVGVNAYALWDNLVYAEVGLYKGLSANLLDFVGKVPITGTDRPRGYSPYGRLALTQRIGGHSFEVGSFAQQTNVVPRDTHLAQGLSDRILDVGMDANYQYRFDEKRVTSDAISASGSFISERASLAASQALLGARRDQWLQTMRGNLSYSFAATFTPTIQYFRTWGTHDPKYFAGTLGGNPDTSGVIYELAFVPWGKPDSTPPIPNLNARFVVQYTNYLRFNGSSADARSNNNLYVGLTTIFPL
jgi:hypothetical protein